LGSGCCANCKKLEANPKVALENIGIEAEVIKLNKCFIRAV